MDALLVGIGDGLSIESFSFASSGGRGKGGRISITRRPDGHSATIGQAAATGKSIASAEITGRVRSGTTTVKMQNVFVASYTVGSGGDTETFTLDFDEFSTENT